MVFRSRGRDTIFHFIQINKGIKRMLNTTYFNNWFNAHYEVNSNNKIKELRKEPLSHRKRYISFIFFRIFSNGYANRFHRR